jgi:Transposase DDE domain group 1
MLATLDNSGAFLAALLRPGNAGANTAADHIAVLDAALAQLPDQYRHGSPILVRADTAGSAKEFLTHLYQLRRRGMNIEFSVGWRVHRCYDVLDLVPAAAWTPTVDAHGEPVESAQLCEITGLLPASALSDYPPGMRLIVRRERPHPGAQLDLIEARDGWRYTAFATTTPGGQLAHLDARHRAHARVEDRIRCGKDTGLGRFPSRDYRINGAWLAAVMIAADLVAWTQTMLVHDSPALAQAEPKTLRYRLLHVAARLTRGQRRLWLHIDRDWRWAIELACAFTRVAALPQPAPEPRVPSRPPGPGAPGRPASRENHHGPAIATPDKDQNCGGGTVSTAT